MHFLYPAFLFALASLAIPVIVHLYNFRRYQKVQFSNVQFLKQLQEQPASRRNIKECLILVARLLALLFLVLAFAKPYISKQDGAAAGQQRNVSIFVDNSYSMQTLNSEGNLLDQAKQKAKEIAAQYGINDRFQLLTYNFEGRHQRLLSRDEFFDAVDEVKISGQNRSLNQVISRQRQLLKSNSPGNGDIYIVSDFQRSSSVDSKVLADKNISINLILLKANNLPNVAIDSVWLLSAVHKPGDEEKLVVKLHNYADQEAAGIPLKLFVNKQQKALASFTIAPRATLTDTLSFSGLKAGWQQGELQLQDNPITFDNSFYLAFNVSPQMPVLVIDNGTENTFIKAAFGADKFFKADRAPEGNVDYTGINKYGLVILTDVKNISAGLARELGTYVKKGNTLAVFPAADADVESYKALLQPSGAAWPQRLITNEVKASKLNLQNPLFKEVFDAMPQNPDLPSVKKYYGLSGAGQGESIMALPGGETFWSGYKSGSGMVYIAAVPLNDDFSNLQRHGLFVPLLYRIALLSGHNLPLFNTLGSGESVETIPLRSTEKEVLKLSSDGYEIIPDVRQQDGSTRLYVADQLQQPGLYNLKKGDSAAAVLAFNDNRRESDLSYLTPAELQKLLRLAGGRVIGANKPVASAINEANYDTQLWKLCIILALIFLAAEIALIRFYKTGGNIAASQVTSTQTTQ
ncbi:BatA and WFA domain-containing protein [Mucilaginibacter sp. UR6-1]|uniref:vWA domain-containing protein n=1 Tax=Mucilaginibacter sp. UR6-1 TaxID=1435643 RepID=UPI001E2C55B6|nr:BatA and WFA domain-containing protein [Mucilaginibacter sp. UR6-1]MCC8410066.1 BatA and WFA domain-containing protein [Mucilaginibacter sp. UR6-1]